MRPSVMVRCSAMECGSLSQPAAWSLGTTYLRQVSASLNGGMSGFYAAVVPVGKNNPIPTPTLPLKGKGVYSGRYFFVPSCLRVEAVAFLGGLGVLGSAVLCEPIEHIARIPVRRKHRVEDVLHHAVAHDERQALRQRHSGDLEGG